MTRDQCVPALSVQDLGGVTGGREGGKEGEGGRREQSRLLSSEQAISLF